MARGRHREPTRRPRPRVALIAAATLLVIAPAADLGLIAGSEPAAVDQAVAAPAGAAEARALDRSSRSAARSTPPPVPSPAPSDVPLPAPSTATPTPAPLPDVVGQRWATTAVNVRSGPSTDHERIGGLGAGDPVGVTGAADSGWTQVVIDGTVGWVASQYLSATEPTADVSGAPCSISTGIEANLTASAVAVYRAVCAAFGDSVSSFGGYRAGDSGDHGSGRAVDIMVSGEPGWEIARYLQAHAAELNVDYVIFEQQIWMSGDPVDAWTYQEDRGSATANHMDHVHVSVE